MEGSLVPKTQKLSFWPGKVAHAYNHSILGDQGGRSQDQGP